MVSTVSKKQWLVQNLKDLSLECKKNWTTREWLDHLWAQSEGEINEDLNSFEIVLSGQQFVFDIDFRLAECLQYLNPFDAFYHYVISYSKRKSGLRYILQRQRIIDSYTSAYNPFYLKAVNSPLKIALIKCFTQFEQLFCRIDNHEHQTYQKLNRPFFLTEL